MDNLAVKSVVIGIVVLLLIPVLVMSGMMTMSAMSGGSMMSPMSGMMDGSWSGMSEATLAVCAAWLGLVGAALVFLIVLLTRRPKSPVSRDKAA